ncbi:MAG: hypothetical protein K2X47_19290 [Bdellovibrionales bacterium]|nr:hypothetical protein [Bdellovibrionales bacterium]
MKNLLVISLILISSLALAKESKIPAKAEKTIEAAEELVGTTKAELKENFQENLGRLDNEINDLKAKIKKNGKEADAELQRQLQEIETQRAHLKMRFDRLNASSQSAWKDVGNGLKKAWSELTGSLKNAKGRFEEKASP